MKALVTFLLIAMVGILNANGQQTMNIHKKNGEVIKVKVDDIDYINYDNSNVVSTNGHQKIRDLELEREQGLPDAIPVNWQINANGFKGMMVIKQSGSDISGYVFNPNDKISGTIQADGTIKFLRSSCSQHYSGKVNGKKMTGTFTWAGSTYNWEASR